MLSCVQLFVILWTVAHQAPLSMSFSRQEYWSGLPFSPPGHLPNPGMEPTSLVSPALVGRFFATVPPLKLQGTTLDTILKICSFQDLGGKIEGVSRWKIGQLQGNETIL